MITFYTSCSRLHFMFFESSTGLGLPSLDLYTLTNSRLWFSGCPLLRLAPTESGLGVEVAEIVYTYTYLSSSITCL
jgi:hypothetical protein